MLGAGTAALAALLAGPAALRLRGHALAVAIFGLNAIFTVLCALVMALSSEVLSGAEDAELLLFGLSMVAFLLFFPGRLVALPKLAARPLVRAARPLARMAG